MPAHNPYDHQEAPDAHILIFSASEIQQTLNVDTEPSLFHCDVQVS